MSNIMNEPARPQATEEPGQAVGKLSGVTVPASGLGDECTLSAASGARANTARAGSFMIFRFPSRLTARHWSGTPAYWFRRRAWLFVHGFRKVT